MTREQASPGAPRTKRWLDIVAWLGVIGAALLAYCGVRPWARVVMSFTLAQGGPTVPGVYTETVRRALGAFLAHPGSDTYALADDISFLWITTLASGVVLGLTMAIWRRSRLAATAYIVWLVVTTLSFVCVVYVIFGSSPASLCQVNCGTELVVARTPMPALWLALGALTVSWVAGGARLASLRAGRAGRLSARGMLRALAEPRRAAALIVTAGILVWFFGFIFTPWATQGCAGYPVNWYHFVSGACSGTDSDSALGRAALGGFGSGSQTIWIETYALFMMLAALIAVWQRGWAPPVVALLWVAPTTWLTAIAISGIPALLANPPRFTYTASTAPWVAGYGPAVSVIGLALAWAGAVALVWRAVVLWRARTVRQRPEPVVPA